MVPSRRPATTLQEGVCSGIPVSIISMEDLPIMRHCPARDSARTANLGSLIERFPDSVVIPGVATGAMPSRMHPYQYQSSDGQRGCAMAHRELWSMLRHKPGIHLVLEDDAIVKPGREHSFCQTIRETMDKMEKEHIHAINMRPLDPAAQPEYFSQGTVAYAISQEGARLAHEHTDSVRHPIDEQLVQLCSVGLLRCGLLADSCFDTAGDIESTITRFLPAEDQ